MPFTIERNDLSTIDADAIVVAANERLQITGGVGLTVAVAAGMAAYLDIAEYIDDHYIDECPVWDAAARSQLASPKRNQGFSASDR